MGRTHFGLCCWNFASVRSKDAAGPCHFSGLVHVNFSLCDLALHLWTRSPHTRRRNFRLETDRDGGRWNVDWSCIRPRIWRATVPAHIGNRNNAVNYSALTLSLPVDHGFGQRFLAFRRKTQS
jgi:hypothetical protein